MARAETKTHANRVSLHIGGSLRGAWDFCILPWFEAIALNVFASELPVAVVIPFTTHAALFREKLLARGISLLGVRFLTPAQLRELLFQELEMHVPLREHLRLLLATAAEEQMAVFKNGEQGGARFSDPEYLAAKSIARAPDHFLRTIDQFSAAGWSFAEHGPRTMRAIIDRFQENLHSCGFTLIYDADRVALKHLATGPPQFSDLLIAGFNGAHWPVFPLLRAAVSTTERADVVLTYPRDEGRAADESWVGTWEELFGGTTPIHDNSESTSPFLPLVRPAESAPGVTATEEPHFLVGLNATEQARAIVTITLKFLAEKSCSRLGVLFPEAGPLSRLVSTLLAGLEVPHHDGIAHFAPGPFEAAAFQAWLQLQENPQLTALLRFVDALAAAGVELFEQCPAKAMCDCLRRAYREVLIDDIAVLREQCARKTERADFVATAQGLARIKFLPAHATLACFLAETKTIFDQLNWKEQWRELGRLAQDWSSALPLEFPRLIYLRWLKEILDSSALTRDPAGAHPYSRVHLLTYVEAEGQEWSHLILAGLNQGAWPPGATESGVLPDEKVGDLNRRALKQGKQGEGHCIIRDGKTFLLGTNEQRQIAARQIIAAIESASNGLALTASLFHDSAPERIWNPSELFSQIYFAARGHVLTQERMSILREQTRSWSDAQSFLTEERTRPNGVAQTRVAYDARRRINQPAGEYEFALRAPIKRPITLRVTQWDKILKHPAQLWMKVFLGVESNERNVNEWSASTGDWAHHWLAQISVSPEQNTFVDLPTQEQIHTRVRDAAQRFREQVIDLCSVCGRTVPDWWLSGWSYALALAECLAGRIHEHEGWTEIATEWTLDPSQIVTLGPGERLRFHGRIDLILSRDRRRDAKLDRSAIWIVDYKTGNNKSLRASSWRTAEARLAGVRKKLVSGDAIQLGLYALAARELGAGDISLSLLSPRTDLERPQLSLSDLAEHADFWRELYRVQETGIFGLVGSMRSEFSFAPGYPLATLPLDEEFLREKWVLTHPAFVDDDDRS